MKEGKERKGGREEGKVSEGKERGREGGRERGEIEERLEGGKK